MIILVIPLVVIPGSWQQYHKGSEGGRGTDLKPAGTAGSILRVFVQHRREGTGDGRKRKRQDGRTSDRETFEPAGVDR